MLVSGRESVSMTAKRDMRRQTADLGRKIFLGINTGKFRMKKEKARPQYEVHGNDAYVVLTGAANMNIDDVMHLMKFTKLGKDRSRGQVEKAMENSMSISEMKIRSASVCVYGSGM